MFNPKDLYNLQKNAREMQQRLKDKIVEVENHGIKIKMNGNQEVLDVQINPELSKEDQEKYIKETMNDAIKKVQQLMAKSMMSGGF